MAVSRLSTTLPFLTPNLSLQPFNNNSKPKPSSINLKATASSTLPSNSHINNNNGSSSSSSRRNILGVGIGVLLTSAAAASVVVSTPLDANATRVEYFATVGDPPCELNFARSGLGYCDLAVGSGEEAPYGELINIHYTARFADGTVFDSSYKRARPLTMRIGVGKVIKGLDQGIFGGEGVPAMLVGGKRKLRIPPQLAYGPEPAGCFSGDCNIPANATLVYDINFVGIYKGNRK